MKTILVAEDDKIVRNNIELILLHNNYNVHTAENGEQALLKVKELLPDLIISDIMMPVMDGYDLFLSLKKDNMYSVIPFIFLTAKSTYEELRTGMNLGADDYLVKPFYVKELLSAIDNALRKAESTEKRFENLRNSIALTIPHEFRTPLMTIMGYSEIVKSELENTSVSEDIKHMIAGISSSAKRFNDVIKRFSFYTDSILLLNDKPFLKKLRKHILISPEMLITKSAADISNKFKRENDLCLNLEDTSIYSDEYLLTFIIEELLINAFKYSDEGSKVTVESIIDDSVYSVTIRNEGVGMSEQQLQNIGAFNQFSENGHPGAGNGVGLITARRLAEAMNIGFNIISTPGKFIEIILSINTVMTYSPKGGTYEMVLQS